MTTTQEAQDSTGAPTEQVHAAREGVRVEEVLQRVASDLSMITDRDLSIDGAEVELRSEPAPGEDAIHIAFKLAFRRGGEIRRGCLSVPLAEAISMACYLMMDTDDTVAQRRTLTTLDDSLKDALLEVGNFVAGATEGALRDALGEDVEVRTEGCQGLRPGAVPALTGEVDGDGDGDSDGAAEGEWDQAVGRARARLHSFPDFVLLLELPVLDP